MSLENEQRVLRESTMQDSINDDKPFTQTIKVSAFTTEHINSKLNALDIQISKRYMASQQQAQLHYSD